MSWWNDSDDVLGDQPADKLSAVWRILLLARRQEGLGPPLMRDALESFAGALQSAKLDGPFTGLVVWQGREPVQEFDGKGGTTALRDAFASAFAAIAEDYQKQVGRQPRCSELIKMLDFIVRPDARSYFVDGTEQQWKTLRLRSK